MSEGHSTAPTKADECSLPRLGAAISPEPHALMLSHGCRDTFLAAAPTGDLIRSG